MSTRTILIILLVLMLLSAAPFWPYSTGWGFAPSGMFFLVLLVILLTKI